MRTEERVILFIMSSVGIAGAIVILLIKKYTVTRWISFSIFLILTAFGLITARVTSQQKHTIYKDKYVIYENIDHPKLKVVYQTKDNYYYTSRTRLIKDRKFFIRYSKKFKPEYLNRKWKGYDEMGNALSINTYEGGVIIAREPVLPENAELISTIDSLRSVFTTPPEGRYFCLKGNFQLEKPLKIKNAKDIILTKPLNIERPLINSYYTDLKLPKLKLTQNDYLTFIDNALQRAESYPFAEADPTFHIGEVGLSTFLGRPIDLYNYVGISSTLESYFSERYGSV